MANKIKKIENAYERKQRQLFYELRLNGFNQKEVAKQLGRSQSYISRCVTGAGDWTVGEAYTLLRLAGVSNEFFRDYFPSRKVGA